MGGGLKDVNQGYKGSRNLYIRGALIQGSGIEHSQGNIQTDIVAHVSFRGTGCPKKTWEFSDELDIVFAMN